MRFYEFSELAERLPVVSLADIRNTMPGLRQETLSRWSRSGKIIKITSGYYTLPGTDMDETDLFAIANRIYTPSFISLESALSHYGLIPETVLSVTSVSTRKTRRIDSPLCTFSYSKVSPDYFFGYEPITGLGKKFLMAYPERALLDLLYLRRDIQSFYDIGEIRLDPERFNRIDLGRMLSMAERFHRRWLINKVKMLLEVMRNA